MASESSIQLNIATNPGPLAATILDSTSRNHQEVVLQTQTGAADPLTVNPTNPLPVQGNVASGTADAGFPVKFGGIFNSAPITLTNGQRGDAQLDANGFLKVNIAAGAAAGGTSSNIGSAVPGIATAVGFSDGTNLQLGRVDGSGNLKVAVSAGGVPAGQDNTSFTSGTTQGLPFIAVADSTNSIGAITQGNQGVVKMTTDRHLFVAPQANPIGGFSPGTILTTVSTNASTIKASAGSLGALVLVNTTATIGYLKVFNKATNPTLGTDTPVWNIPIPANTSAAGVAIGIPAGISFSAGIAIAVTGAIALLDNTNSVAGIAVNYGFI